jgi:hypothetical protein
MSTHQPTEPLAPVDQQPVLGLHGEPCATCGAPLAADQRYCLACGARRADARLPFRDILAAPGERPAPAAPSASPATSDSGRNGTLAALAGLGVVLLALGMGVLIGQAGQSDQSAQTTPQVINLGGEASTGGAPPAAAATGAAAGAAKASKSGAAKKSAGSSGDASSTTSKAKNTQLKSLDNLSPEQYQKKSQKLPKTVGTGGAPPPKDNKPAAGGGDFQTIG